MSDVSKKIVLAFKLARVSYFPVGIIPVLLGTAVAWQNFHQIVWWKFLVCLIGMFFAHLGANAANDYFDELSGIDRFAFEKIPEGRGSQVCGSGILTSGKLTIKEARVVVVIFFSLAFVAGVILTITSGWPVALLAAVGFFFGMFYCAPPVAFGYVGYFLGELGIFFAFGPLPVIGAYFIQTGKFSWEAVIASLPIGLLTTSVVFNQHFAHVQADRAGGKRTPVVLWGEKPMRVVSKLLLIGVYISIIAGVIINKLPIYTLAALLTAPLILIPAFRLSVPAGPSASLAFLFKVVRTNILTSIIIIISFVLTS